jgi:hypothetical protein
VTIDVRPALATAGKQYTNSMLLAEAARQSILEVLREPDLLAGRAA